MIYFCTQSACPYDGPKPYQLDLPAEACIDEHNCATIFCPHCQHELRIQQPDTITDNAR